MTRFSDSPRPCPTSSRQDSAGADCRATRRRRPSCSPLLPPLFRLRTVVLLLPVLLLAPSPAAGWYPRLIEHSTLNALQPGQPLGKNRPYLVAPGETLMEVAYRGGLGYNNLRLANPGQDPWAPQPGHDLILPYRTLLPPGIAAGITINLAEYRLYLAWREQGRWRVRVYPIGLGQEGWATPEGEFTVINTIEDPVWTPPESLRAEKPGLPAAVPPGPGNPLGRYWIGLSAPGVGIHGTNQPYGIGRRVSHGCIRLYPRDIEDLAGRVTVGMPVRILYRPYKVGRDGERLLIEVHPDYLGRYPEPEQDILAQARALGWPEAAAPPGIDTALRQARGIPVAVPVGTGRLARFPGRSPFSRE